MSRKTKKETVIETKGIQSHDCDPCECKAEKVLNRIEGRARYLIPTVAITNEISEVSDEYAVQLPMPKKNMLRAVFRKWQRDTSANTCPNWSTFGSLWRVCSFLLQELALRGNTDSRETIVRTMCPRKLDEPASYFESTYMEKPNANKKPPFSIELWKQYDVAKEVVARITFSVEVWH